MREIDYAQYRTETFRYYSQQFAPIRAMKIDEGERLYAPGTDLQEALYFWIFPNLMVNMYPDNVSTNLIVPLSHDKTLTSLSGSSTMRNPRSRGSKFAKRWNSAMKCSRKISAYARACSEACAQRLMTRAIFGAAGKWRASLSYASRRIP